MRPRDAFASVVLACLLVAGCSRLTFVKPNTDRGSCVMPVLVCSKACVAGLPSVTISFGRMAAIWRYRKGLQAFTSSSSSWSLPISCLSRGKTRMVTSLNSSWPVKSTTYARNLWSGDTRMPGTPTYESCVLPSFEKP